MPPTFHEFLVTTVGSIFTKCYCNAFGMQFFVISCVKYTSRSFSKRQKSSSPGPLDQESSRLGLDVCCLVVLEILTNRTPHWK